MKSTQYQKLNKDVLLEWGYDDDNFIQEPYKIIYDSRNFTRSYAASDTTITKNNSDNQLFQVDPLTNRYVKVDISKYNFLSVDELVPTEAVIHDTLRIYFPSNWIFGEYQGIYLRLYTYDKTNKVLCDLSNFFFDVNETQTVSYLNKDIIPPLEYQEKNWNQYIELNIPSLYHISRERFDAYALEAAIASKLTNGVGLSQEAPIFVDFNFITKITQLEDTKYYSLSPKLTFQFPQRPEMEGIKLVIQESNSGDYFEIFGTLNGRFSEFSDFITNATEIGKFYKLEFIITTFEQNIGGKSVSYLLEDNFQELVEFRPILKYSTSSATIDVEMRIVDKDSGSVITKKAVYGMKPDQLSKYLLNTKRINVRNTYKPKIYTKTLTTGYLYDRIGKSATPENRISVPVPQLKYVHQGNAKISAFCKYMLNKVYSNIGAKINNYVYNGEMKISIKPFDNIIEFTLQIRIGNNKLEPFDLTSIEDLKLIFKDDNDMVEVSQYFNSPISSASLGICSFKITEEMYNKIREMYLNGARLFYITSTNQGIRNVIYSGLFTAEEPAFIVQSDIETPQPTVIVAEGNLPNGTVLVSRRIADPVERSVRSGLGQEQRRT
jgi:hypothetical protein